MEQKTPVRARRWGPTRHESTGSHDPLAWLQDDLNKVFESFHRDFFGVPFERPEARNAPFFVEQRGDRVEVTVYIRGQEMGDVRLTLGRTGDMLRLRARPRIVVDPDTQFRPPYPRSAQTALVEHFIALPCVVSAEGATARLEDGVLKVRLAKRTEEPDATHIQVMPG